MMLEIRPALFPFLKDWQISLTFPVFLSIFRYFLVFYSMNFTNTNIYVPNTLELKNHRKKNKNKNWPKCLHFSSILGKFPWLYQYVQNSLTVFPFSRFSSLAMTQSFDLARSKITKILGLYIGSIPIERQRTQKRQNEVQLGILQHNKCCSHLTAETVSFKELQNSFEICPML